MLEKPDFLKGQDVALTLYKGKLLIRSSSCPTKTTHGGGSEEAQVVPFLVLDPSTLEEVQTSRTIEGGNNIEIAYIENGARQVRASPLIYDGNFLYIISKREGVDAQEVNGKYTSIFNLIL
jgi:hypothetical protein